MIVAVATDGNMVAQHFGRCSEYTLFKIGDGVINEVNVIANPGHEPGFLPGYLAQMGVKCIIAGGMGPRAQSLFAEKNIETCVGAAGPTRDVAEAYLSGNLQTGVSRCDHQYGCHNCD